MQCNFCKSEIQENSHFCNKCGMPVVQAPDSEDHLPQRIALLQNYIPAPLARKIMSAGKKIESERRHVTILFTELMGFAELSEKGVDLEVVSGLLNDCLKTLISVVVKYEGVVDKFVGDGIMAIFGAPLAHENDPEQAVRCALEMKSEVAKFNNRGALPLPVAVGFRAALHSGIVIAGNVGNDLRMNYSVVGDTVNLASRLIEHAHPGEIYVSTATQSLISGTALTDGPFAIAIKGRTDLVEVYKLRVLRESMTRRPPAHGVDEFVGRTREMQTITEALDAGIQGKHTCIFVRGEAGVGKSRLKAELVKAARQRQFEVVEGRCSSFETSTPYYLWNTLLKSLLRLDIDSSEHQAREKLHQCVETYSMQEDEPYLGTLLSLRYEQILFEVEELRKRRIFDAVARLLNQFALQARVVVILEDLHWIDTFSEELLESIFSSTRKMPGLIVSTFRDEYINAKRFLHHGIGLDLNRLNRPEALTLMKRRLGAEEIPAEVEKAVLHRSEGNPFFIQEILKTLIDHGVIVVRNGRIDILSDNVEAGIPPTIQGVIMSRIDRLQGPTKELLFSASSIGREFSRPVLEKVQNKNDISRNLRELLAVELILEKEESKRMEYLFKHYLIQDVAYNTILHAKRKEIHAEIANAIESLYADRLPEFYELIAFHYEKAEQWDKAAEYLSRSGHKVHQIYSKEESKNFFKRKEVAMQKLFQSGSAKWSLWATMKAITPPLIAMLIPILPIFAYIRLLGKARTPDFTLILVVSIVASLLCIWYAVSLWHLGVIPFLRGRPKLYDLSEDQVRVLFPDGSNLAIHFSEIESMRFFDPEANGKRPLKYKLIDPMSRIADYSDLTFRKWFSEVILNLLPPYSFGFGSRKGEIHVLLKTGYRAMRILVPWFNSPVRSKDMSLLPFAPKAFFEQFQVAFEQWKRAKKSRIVVRLPDLQGAAVENARVSVEGRNQ
jgi:class 3 adenylate cyclase